MAGTLPEKILRIMQDSLSLHQTLRSVHARGCPMAAFLETNRNSCRQSAGQIRQILHRPLHLALLVALDDSTDLAGAVLAGGR